MNRRGFLRGVFGGVTSAGLIVAAKPAEVEAFASPLVKDAPMLLDSVLPPQRSTMIGEHLYNERGELVAIVTEIHVERPEIDVTMWANNEAQFMAGPMHIDIRAQGVGPLQIGGDGLMPRLGGRRA